MADFNTLLNGYLTANGVGEAKKAEVAATAEAKKASMSALPTGNDLLNIGGGVYTGKGLDSAGELERDVRTLSPLQLNQKYGNDLGQELTAAKAQGMENFRSRRTAERPDGGTWDSVSDVGLGFVNGLAGIGALGVGGAEKLGLAPEGAGAFVAGKIGDMNAFVQGTQSSALQDRREALTVVQGLDERDNRAKYEEERKTDGEVIASLRRIGRDFMDSTSNTLSDPMLTTSGVSSGIGSLLSGGLMGKGIRMVGSGIASRVAVGASGPSKAAAVVAKASEKAAMPAAIGGLEAGGAYQDTTNRAIELGATPSEANDAGLVAAGIQAPVAVATGALVSKFEGNPLRVGSLPSVLGNIGKEGVEEAIQSGSGQLAGNIGLKTEVDPTVDLAEGVGAQAGQGALFGMGTAGALQAPGAAGRVVADTASAGAKAAVSGAKALIDRGDRILSAAQAEETQKATDAQVAAVESVPDLAQGLQTAVQAKGGEQAPQMAEYLTRLFDKARFDPAEAQQEAPVIQGAVQGAQDRFTALRQVAQVANDPNTSEADRAKAGAYLVRQYAQYEGLLVTDLLDAVRQIDEQDPLLQKLDEYQDVVIGLREHPEIKAAIAQAQNALASKAVQNQFNDVAMSTPEGVQAAQQMAEAVVELASLDPEKVDPKMIDVIRSHAVAGRLNLSPQQTGILKTAYEMLKATKEIQEQKKALGLSYADLVTQEVQTRDDADASQLVKKSAMEHARGVLSALRSGDRDLAAGRLQDFALFAQHMQNKVGALNASAISGKNEPYLALSPKEGRPWYKNTKGLGLDPQKLGSVQFAQQTALDARAVASVANAVIEAFPELGVQSVTPVSLGIDPKLERKAADIVKEQQPGRNTTTEQEVNPKETPKEQVSPDVQSAPETTQDEQTTTKAATEVDPDQQPLPFEKPVEPLKEAEQPQLPLDKPEAAVEPETSETPEGSPDPYANLLGSKDGRNWFQKAFRQPDGKTRLKGLGDQVVSTIRKALSSMEAFEELLGDKASHTLTPALVEAYQAYLGEASKLEGSLDGRLKTFLSKVDITKAKPTNPVQQWIRGKVLNLVEDRDGELAYQPELIQTAILAGLQWLLTTEARPTRVLDEQDIADILGIAATEVPDGAEEFFNEGLSIADAKQSLADTISRFWGVEANREAPLGYTKGIPEAAAAELIKAMQEIGLVEIFDASFGSGDQTRTFKRVALKEDPGTLEAMEIMRGFPSAIEQLALTEPEEVRFIEEPPKKAAQFQMRNRLVRNTEQQIQAIRAEQRTPHFINTHMVSLLEALDEDGVVEVFGAGKLDEERLNRNHALSLKGKNASIRGAYRSLRGLLAELRNKAETLGQEPSEVPIHYDYNVSRVGRLHMLGLHNPQGSKLMREAVLPTRVKVDLNRPENFAKFALAIGQAWGEKVHKQPRGITVNAVADLSRGPFAPVVRSLESFLDGSLDQEQLVPVLKNGFKIEKNGRIDDRLSVAAVHAALELARFNRASEAERAEFTTDLYVEADGVTDGPINALIHLATGAFTPRWVRLVAKGGLFLGRPGMTVNDYQQIDGQDLYQEATNAFEEIMGRHQQELADIPGMGHLLNDLLTLMSDLLGSDVSFDGKTLEIGRGIAKNPLTVTIYGSGALGIADKVAGAMIGAFYEKLSEAAQSRSNEAGRLIELMENLANIQVQAGKNGLSWKDVSLTTPQSKSQTNQGYTLSAEQLKNLRQNVLHLFVTPLREAIEATIEDTGAGRQALREAIQVQSIFLQHAFMQKVQERLAAKSEDEQKEFLSQAEMDAIYDELKAMSPLVETGTMTFFVAGSERTDVEASVFAKSLDDELATPAYVYGPKDAGVAGIPYLVIGPGDGQMMQYLSTMPGAPQGTLKVFDGVHIKLDTLDEDSRKVNQAVHMAWGLNPLGAVNESFQGFLGSVSYEGMSQDQITALSKALGAKKDERLSPKQIAARVAEIGRNLNKLTQEAEARHKALARVAMSVDHMASAEAPFQAEGEALPADAEAVAARLNQLAREELLALRAPKATAEDAVASKSEDSPLELLSSKSLRALATKLRAPAELKNLLKEAVRALPAGWEVVRGTEEQTAAYALSKGETPHRGRLGEVIKGYTSLKQQRIYLNTQDPETLLHELLHATTTQKILDHYNGQTNWEVSEAVTQLETLMGQWLAMEDDLSALTPEQRRAYQDALRVVKAEANTTGRSEAENKAAALDEFLAWSLSNQDLIKIAQQTKVENPLARVVKRVLISLKNLIWGRKMSPMVRSDMYSALRFNASVLMNSTPTLQSRASKVIRRHSVQPGANPRLTDLHKRLAQKIYAYLDGLSPDVRMDAEPRLTRLVASVQDAFANTFPMSAQEESVFGSMVMMLSTQMQLDPATLARVQELYTHVNKTLTVESLMADPEGQDDADRYVAQRKFSILKGIDFSSGKSVIEKDLGGRTTLMSAFLALAATNEDFRSVLAKMAVPKAEKLANTSLDNVLTNVGRQAMDGLSRTLSGEGRNRSDIRAAIDALTLQLTADVQAQENILSQLARPVTQAIDGLNDKTVEVMQKGSKAAIEKLSDVQDATDSKVVKGLAEVGKAIAAVANEQESRLLAEGWISTANRLNLFRPMHDFLNDLVGRTESNASVYDMIKRVRSAVQQARQQFREHLPGLIAQRFSRELSKEEWTHLFKGLAKTDLAALRQGMGVEQILELLSDKARLSVEIRKVEDLIQAEVSGQNWSLIQDKARQLAEFMNTGRPGSHLLRNAEAVASLFGVPGAQPYTPSRSLVGRVDQLISLYALEGLDEAVRASLASLAQDEADGLSFVMAYLIGQRTDEQSKLVTPKARMNHYKGYVPSEPHPGAQLVVLRDSEAVKKRLQGYRRVGDYKGSSAEFGAEPRGYYFSPVASRALFKQGIMQNVRQTASGVDPVTGHSHGPMIAGRIVDPRTVQKISRRSRNQGQGEPLMPIFDGSGQVIAYERSVDPNQEALLERDTHLARMIGVWRGRQVEESLAGKFNEILVEALHDIWVRDQKDGREDEFVDLMDEAYLKTDPVVKDAVELFTPEAWEHIRRVFGGDGFRVRKDMLNDAIGYRSPSVGDVWTGTTRLAPEAADVAKRLAVGIFGLDAYRYLVTAEKLTQNLVSEARQLIVVKSVVVPVSNFIANVYQLASRGVSLSRIAKDMPKKLTETNAYVERRQRQIELEAELRAAESDIVAVRRIKAELQSIEDANKRMSIWPLIKAGEFSSISEAGSLEKEETTLFEGKLTQYIEQKVNKLPPGVRTLGRYALITQDTALFQGMRRAMEYGDFLAKAITYDHLTQQKGLSQDEALARVTEEFVNYDRLSGRFRTYAEDLGLLWFWNFKVRIAKIAVATLRENPIHALLTSLVPTPDFVGSIGTPLSDNLFSVGLNGDLGWSMGPGMGFRAHEMNPWLSLLR